MGLRLKMYRNNKVHLDKGDRLIKMDEKINIGTAMCHKHLVHVVNDPKLVTCKTCLQTKRKK